jgi:hypothetical protein
MIPGSKQLGLLILLLNVSTLIGVNASRFPRTNLGIRTTSCTSDSSNLKNKALLRVGGGRGSPARGGASVAVAGAARTMSAGQYKVLK